MMLRGPTNLEQFGERQRLGVGVVGVAVVHLDGRDDDTEDDGHHQRKRPDRQEGQSEATQRVEEGPKCWA